MEEQAGMRPHFHDVRASVSLVFVGGGCGTELGKRHSVIAQFPVTWVGTEKYIFTLSPFVYVLCHTLFPLYSMYCLIPLSLPSSRISEKGVDCEPSK